MAEIIYYIYHIPGVKIGCTDNVKRRVVRVQGYDNYEILEEHTDIYEASDREIQLQKEYGYKVDTNPYYKVIQRPTKEGRSKAGKKGIKRLRKYNQNKEHQSMAGRKGGTITAAKMTFEQRSYAGKKGGKVTTPKLVKWVKENPEHLRKIQKISAEKRQKAILQYDKDGNFIKEWDSIKECAELLELHATSITVVCKGGRQKTSGGFVFKYKEELAC